MKRYDFANILLSGPCNLKCPYCIGRNPNLSGLPHNLNAFPLTGLDAFIETLNRYQVKQVSLTGSNTEPQLYLYEEELIQYLRSRISGVKLSLHTNGTLMTQKMAIVNLYDRVSVSMTSFNRQTRKKTTGVDWDFDLERIVRELTVPLKISTIITDDNLQEIPSIVARCKALGVSRMVLRKQYHERRDWDFFPNQRPCKYFAGNPVYSLDGMEIAIWDFQKSTLQCLNLFSDGAITEDYEIANKL
jgi:molybdenum cofactor biosynthesis enzyme MoaA